MKKSKLMKALLVFGMSVVTATSIVGFTACGHEHIDSDSDGVCDECGIEMPDSGNEGGGNEGGGNQGGGNQGGNQGGGNEGGGNEGGGETETPADVKVNASDLTVGTLADGDTLGDGLKVVGAPAVDANKKTITYKGESLEIANRIKLSSKLTNKDTPMGIEVTPKAAATVVVYYYSGSSNNTRGLELYASDKSTIVENTTTELSDGNVMATAMFSVEAKTTYYIGASVAGVNIYYLAVVYGDVGETWEDHTAVPAQCGVAGNIAYSNSNYGRYKNASGAFIMGNKYSTPALEHSYTLKASSIVIPTDDPDTNPGKATLTCANGHETDVDLPVLSSDKYTARPAVGEEGTYTITIEGVQISFTATGVGEHQTTYTDVYKLEDFMDVTVGTEKTANQNCVYASSGTAAADTDGSLKCGEGTNATSAYISLGTPITSGVVKITGSIKVASTNGSWTFLQFLNSDETPAEFLGFRTGSKGVWGYRVDGGTPPATPIAAATTVFHNFEILLDFDSKKVTIKVDETVLADNVDLGTKATGLSSIMINCNAGRYIHLGSVTIATQD